MSRNKTPAALTYPKTSLYEAVRAAGEQIPAAVAYEYMGSACSYEKFLRQADQTAAAFAALGVAKGQSVTLCLPNCPQAVECFYGLNRLGAVANIVHPLSAPEEICFALNLSNSSVIVTADRMYEAVRQAVEQTGRSVTVVVTSMADRLPRYKRIFCRSRPSRGLGWKAFLEKGQGRALSGPVGSAPDPAAILYSGGTTGKTKGILLNNGNLNALAVQTVAAAGFGPIRGLRMLSAMPMFHGFGLGIGIHTALLGGAACILVPRIRPDRYGKLLLQKRPNLVPGVPTLFEHLLRAKLPPRSNLGFLKGVFCGGDALSEDLRQRVDSFLADHGARVRIRQGYGLTECVTASCLVPPEGAPAGSVGLPFADMAYEIRRPGTGEPLPVGTEGEICISGPTVMAGYVEDPQATAETLHRDPDGGVWLRTGDLGRVDEKGFVYFSGRIKRMIVTSGYNVYPAQVEAVLEAQDLVERACVIGVPDACRVERVKAFVVLRQGAEPSEPVRRTLLDHCRARLSAYAVPREIEFRRELPRTKVGKVDYRRLEQHGS